MFNRIRTSYEHTIHASYVGYITQAIVNNFAPLLFLTFAAGFRLSLDKITFITTMNFLIQLSVDLLSARLVDKIGWRVCIVGGHLCASVGLVGLAVFPLLLPSPYAGILLAVAFYAVGGGVIEVLVSPIVEACPTKKKEAAMSLLHSFYCWGYMGVVLVSAAFFYLFGVQKWGLLSCLWAIVPLCNALYFVLVPLYPIVSENQTRLSIRQLVSDKVFWLIVAVMVCAGASELAVSQWASAFAEQSLGLSKAAGDLAGPCAFAAFQGLSRVLYGAAPGRLPLKKVMLGSAVLCIACYALMVWAPYPVFSLVGCALCGFAVGIFWPGTFSIAACNLPGGGTAMYAFLALAGDIGCSVGPTVVGLVAHAHGGNLKAGIAPAVIFPLVILLGISLLKNRPGHE